MLIDTTTFTPVQQAALEQLLENIDRENEETKLNAIYGEHFVTQVGLDALRGIPVVTAESVNLENVPKYPEQRVQPHHLGDHSVVRGLDSLNRPFIAIKLKQLDRVTGKAVEVVEVIFKRYSICYTDEHGKTQAGIGASGHMHEDNYTTALTNRAEDGTTYQSVLYSCGGMSDDALAAVGLLLNGETIDSLTSSNWLISLV